MSNFSIENIGAFELNHGTISVVDRVLEATTHGPAPTSVHAGCNRIGDGALEAMVVTGPNLGPPTGRGWTGACCGRIDDGALEATGFSSINPSYGIACSSTQGPMCRRIDGAN